MALEDTEHTIFEPNTLNSEALRELTGFSATPCLTLMMPTHRMPPERETDPLQFKNLVSELEEKMVQNGFEDHVQLLEELEQVYVDRDFWNHQRAGLAVFMSPGVFRSFRVPVELPALTIVSDTFHVKPLYRYFQERDRFQVLVLNRDDVKLFEGNRFHLDEVPLEGKVPLSMKAALGAELTDDHYNAGTASPSESGNRMDGNVVTGTTMHGYMEKSQEQDNDTIRFFRVIDRAIDEHFSSPTGLPLVLAALPENQAVFHEVSKNPSLQKKGLEMDASNLSADELREKVWEVYYPQYQKNLQALLERQGLAASQHMSQTLLEDIALDAIDGKIDVLLVEEGRIIKGRVLEDERRIEYAESGVDDLIDDLSAIVIEKGGRVVILREDKMPHDSGAVSINRY